MMTDELSMLGYCWTGSVISARTPISTITRFTTAASTGCLMKMSVKLRIMSVHWVPGQRCSERDVAGSAAVGRDRFRLRHDRDQHCVAQLERARGRNLLARHEAVANHYFIARERFDLDRALLRPRLAVLVLHDDEHEI